VLARAERTAREMREIGGENFIDFKSIRKEVEAEREVVGLIKESAVIKEVKPAVKPQQNGRKTFMKKIPVFRKGF
jgi:hypothetical protein